MEMYVFARFHARPGQEKALEDAVAAVIPPTREEPGCLSIHGFRSIKDPQLFYIHSRWTGENALDIHLGLPHTVRFLEAIELLLDQSHEVTRAEVIV
jgi:quinol monooxygenase YgiN